MTAELIIHILLAISLCAVGFLLVWAVQVLGELNTLSRDIVRLYDDLKDQIRELETENNKSKNATSDYIKNQILENLRQRMSRPNITVKDDDKPLDFPNDRK